MFLHSGASLHGHEYSNTRSSPQQPPRRLPFLRSALRHTPEPEARARTPTSISTPMPASTESTPSSRPVSYHEHAASSPRPSRPRPTSDYIPKRELSVRFQEPETEDEVTTPEVHQSEDECSAAYSDLSDVGDLSDGSTTTTRRRRRKRAPRKSTQFLLAHPAPRLRTKQRRLVQIRPRLLLQLQELSDKRPVPAFDILPSSLVAGSIIIPRLAMRCPRLFRVKPELGLNDLLIVRSEDYDAPDAPSTPNVEDSLDQRDLLGVISPLPHMGDNVAEIVMEDGSTWESSLMPNGSYEFIGVDERGGIRTARWIKKPVAFVRPVYRSTAGETPPPSPAPAEYKWTFSMINPDTRRHPIMGSLISNTLDVFETYNTMSSSSGRYPPTRPGTFDTVGATDWLSNHAPTKEGRATRAVPDDIKLLMVATAAWINLRQEGWPASANPKLAQSLSQRRTPSIGVQPRSQTFPLRGSPAPTSPPQKVPQTVASPVSYIPEAQVETTGRRRSMSTTAPGFVKRLVAPRASEDGRRPTLDGIYFNEVEKPAEKPSSRRRLSVRQITNKLFRRRSSSVAQQQEDYFGYKLEY
ncbi:Fc.00g113660.m01.CDS01 [Cosmosporella sp. VM-42]